MNRKPAESAEVREEEAAHDDGLPEPIQESDLDRQPHPGRDTSGQSGFDGGDRL